MSASIRYPGILLLTAVVTFGQESAPTELETYLGLTRTQSAAIARNEGTFRTYVYEKSMRLGQIYDELTPERERRPLDPLALGVRYVEIEQIRREIEARANARAAENRALLTVEQRTKLPALDEARRLQAPAQQAFCAGLISPSSSRAFIPGDSAVMSIATPIEDPFCSSMSQRLFTYLELTPDQSHIADETSARYKALALEKKMRTTRIEGELTALTAAETLDPLAIGLRHVEIEMIEDELREAAKQAIEEFRASLTPAQKSRLQPLARAAELQFPAGAAECIGLLDPADPLAARRFSTFCPAVSVPAEIPLP